MPRPHPSLLQRVRDGLLAAWFQPGPHLGSTLLAPLAWLYARMQTRARAAQEREAARTGAPGRPVVVVGNLIVGGAGKTPTTLAIIRALLEAGHRPGVVSRGHGRQGKGVIEVQVDADPQSVGDEPLLIRRRSGIPVVVGSNRFAAARRLLEAHPLIDVIVCDDGLQHRRLKRDVEVVVFDERGVGNGRLLPAGPLREPFVPSPPPGTLVLYNHHHPSTAWPGFCAQRRLSGAWPLGQWLAGQGRPCPLAELQGRPLLAMAGIAVPERFFAALEDAGLTIQRLPMPDHHRYTDVPWPAGTPEVITTEKDAVKLSAAATLGVKVWVVGLDLLLPPAFVADLLARLPQPGTRAPGDAAENRPHEP